MARSDYNRNRKTNHRKDGGYQRKNVPRVTNSNRPISQSQKSANPDLIRLNRYVANAGICSRREADTYIAAGNVSVNGKVITEMGYKVKKTDDVRFDGRKLNPEKKEYVLLNKPKNFITTTNDEKGRRTVMDLVSSASNNRLYPVGRLDRDTTGLLLFTNDGDMAKKLTHPKHGVRKIYHVHLDNNLKVSDIRKIEQGLELEDGPVEVHEVSYVQGATKKEIGIEIHSGRNRIVRRIFGHLGYEVVKLDRVIFAGLTKKDLPRGHWRYLTQQEVINLGMIK
ncbi:MAG: pseudouridine synthase [Bacteroidota bacterium]